MSYLESENRSENTVAEHSLYQALTLSERLQASSNFPKLKDIDAAEVEVFTRWCAHVAFDGDDNLMQQRLQADGLSLDTFRQLLAESTTDLIGRSKRPQWAKAFDKNSSATKDIELPNLKNEERLSGELLNVFAPQIFNGLNHLKTKLTEISLQYPEMDLNANDFAEEYVQDLYARLATASGRTFTLELQVSKIQNLLSGDTPEQRFESFVALISQDSFKKQFICEYAVLTRLVVESINQWCVIGEELIQRLGKDWNAISSGFKFGQPLGKLTDVKTGAGDTHKSGRSVAILSFSCGFKVVYKPRSMAVEQTFGELINWCNEKGFSTPLRRLHVIDKQHYGWVEFVSHASCAEITQLERFYHRQGALLALTHLLHANDFHSENIIASGEDPVLIDLETLFHPWMDSITSGESNLKPADALRRTVLRTGLLPQRLWTQDGEHPGVDLSGFSDADEQVTPEPVLAVENAGTDEMRFVRKHVSFTVAMNQPDLNGSKVKATDFQHQIVAGFREMYQLFQAHANELLQSNSPLQAFGEVETRVIFRETRIYATFLMESLHPDFMRSALERDMFFDNLWITVKKRPYMARLIQYERADLQQLDIPYFTTKPGSVDLWSASEEQIPGVFKESGLDRVNRTIAGLNDDDMERQSWIIKCSMYSATLASKGPEKNHFNLVQSAPIAQAESLVAASEAIGDTIHKLAFVGKDDASWFSWKPVGNSHWDLEPMTPALYDGLCGVALYLAYLGKVTNDDSHRELAQKALTTARYLWTDYSKDIESIGAFSGWSGIIYTLIQLSTLWQEDSLLDEAESLVSEIEQRIAEDREFDLVGGSAGAILVLLRLYEKRPSNRILAMAKKCGEHLLNHSTKNTTGIGWVLQTAGDTPLAGMSHGVAGVAWALQELYVISGYYPFGRAAEEALAYERSLYSEKENNWPDLRQGERPKDAHQCESCYYLTAWCHGAPGIGLARIAMSKVYDDSVIASEIGNAVNTTLEYGFDDNHSLCHGALGNIDLLLTAADKDNRLDLQQKARQIAGQILAGTPDHGWITGLMYNLETPGLMVGLSGMGYELLRIAYPDQVPSILSLEVATETAE